MKSHSTFTPGQHMARRSFLGTTLGTTAAGLLWSSEFPSIVSAAKTDSASRPVVDTTAGKIRGLAANKVLSFKGVPYGASTAGAGRFKPPVSPQPWTGIRETAELGPRSPQSVRVMVPEMGDALTGHGPMSEDCLTLNVWTPGLGRSSKRPVMVWFHGGGFRTGWSGSVMYDGQELARKHDVVVVGVNHRLNLFGFLYLAEIGGEKYSASTNAGMLDIVLALEWVRDNIAAFGGDSGNVTLFGQSGGGGKVSTLQAMPRAKGLFHRAIVQSTISDTALWGQPRADATKTAETLLSRLGMKPDQLDGLSRFSTEQLLAAMGGGGGTAETDRSAGGPVAGSGNLSGDLSLRFVPVVDGSLLPADPFDPVAPEISAGVPLIVGSVGTESVPYAAPNDPYWTMDSLDDAALRDRVKRALRANDAAADDLVALYKKNRPKASNLDIAMILTSDAGTLRTAGYTIAEHKAAQNRAPVYLYQFEWYSPVRQGRVRAMHGVELAFAFDHVDDARWMIGDGRERYALAASMSGAWAAFAHTGDPNHKGLPAWRPFDAARRTTMVFNTECKAVDDPHREERLAIASIQGNRSRR
jgi:para-nitrobenzyl esterase